MTKCKKCFKVHRRFKNGRVRKTCKTRRRKTSKVSKTKKNDDDTKKVIQKMINEHIRAERTRKVRNKLAKVRIDWNKFKR